MLAQHSSLYRLVHPINRQDFEEIHKLEESSFPEDEGASLETILFRGKKASQYFYQLKKNSDSLLVGFINGTCTNDVDIKEESMTTHDETGCNLVIHSITVSPNLRRQGIGKALLNDYIIRIADYNPEIQNILLLCKGYLISFYTLCGFCVVCESKVCHGKEQWFEMKLDLNSVRFKQFQVDAFTMLPYKGNPAAVVFSHNKGNLNNELWMQQIANENNLAETAFLSARTSNELYSYDLRWFTPATEVELCGHATLAAAHALYSTHRVPKQTEIKFHTLHSGILLAKQNEVGLIELDFPSTPSTVNTDDASFNLSNDRIKEIISKALHIHEMKYRSGGILYCGQSKYDVLVELPWEAFAQIDAVDFEMLKEIKSRGIVATCRAHTHVSEDTVQAIRHLYTRQGNVNHLNRLPLNNRHVDFYSRSFFPNCGINEDPVTGSTHCALAPYWIEKLLPTDRSTINSELLSAVSSSSGSGGGVKQLVGYQASDRGGYVTVSMDDYSADRVTLSGHCVTTLESQLLHL